MSFFMLNLRKVTVFGFFFNFQHLHSFFYAQNKKKYIGNCVYFNYQYSSTSMQSAGAECFHNGHRCISVSQYDPISLLRVRVVCRHQISVLKSSVYKYMT